MPEQMPTFKGIDRERLDQFSQFFKPTLPRGKDPWYNKIRQIMGKELSIANLEREDMISFIKASEAAQVFLLSGQSVTGRKIMTGMQVELKLTGSIDGRILDNIFSNKMQYEQTQHVHEHIEPAPKRSRWPGGKK